LYAGIEGGDGAGCRGAGGLYAGIEAGGVADDRGVGGTYGDIAGAVGIEGELCEMCAEGGCAGVEDETGRRVEPALPKSLLRGGDQAEIDEPPALARTGALIGDVAG
jgi:hypothetical protein